MFSCRKAALLFAMFSLAACSGEPPAGKPGSEGQPISSAEPPSPWSYRACESANSGGGAAGEDALPDGIWEGTLTNELLKTTEPYQAVVGSDGRFLLKSSGHTGFAGLIAVSGNSYTGTGLADSGGIAWNDGTLQSSLSVAGTIAERDSLAGDWALASGDAGCFDLAYDAQAYETPSSLALLAGTWIDNDDWGYLWLSLAVDPDGNFAGDGLYGCRYAGRFALIDERFNLYEVTATVTSWADESYACPNVGDFTGFAYIENLDAAFQAASKLRIWVASSNNALGLDMHR